MAPASCWQAEAERGPLSCGTSSLSRISVCPQSSSLTTLRAGSEGEPVLIQLFPCSMRPPLHLVWQEADECSPPRPTAELQPRLLRGNPKFELRVVPVLVRATAVGAGWDTTAGGIIPSPGGMWLSPHLTAGGNLSPPEHCPWSCHGGAELCPLSVPLCRVLRRTRVNGDNRL